MISRGPALSAKDDACALPTGLCECRFNPLHLRKGAEWSQVRLWVMWVADNKVLTFLRNRSEHCVKYRPVNKAARAGNAGLTRGAKIPRDQPICRRIDIRVIKNDDR